MSAKPFSAIRLLAITSPLLSLLLIPGPAASGADCVPPPANLAGWWRAEGNGNDSVGTNNATLVNGVGFAAGVVGQAFDFNGVDGRAIVPYSPDLDVGTGDFSIEAWIRPLVSVTDFGVMTVVCMRVAPDIIHDLGYEFSVIDGKLALRLSTSLASGGQTLGQVGPDLRDGQFHHVAVTVARNLTNGGRFFVDGQAILTFDPTPFSASLSVAEPLRIGNHATPSLNCFFKGQIDEVSLYKRALATNEIGAICFAGRAGKCLTNSPPTVPVITDFAPKSGPRGAQVTLTGSGFDAQAANNVVYFGAVRAQVVSATASSVTVLVPTGATFAPPTLTTGGLTACAQQPFLPTFTGTDPSISTGTFAPRFDLAADGPIRTVIADLDGDGKPDLAVAAAGPHGIFLFRNISASGSLTPASFAPKGFIPTLAVADSPWNLIAADVDGDGKLDLVEANRGSNVVSILRNVSTPGILDTNSFAPEVDLPAGDLPVGVAVRDVDGDGRPDLIVANFNSGNIAVFQNRGAPGQLTAASFAPPVFFAAGAGAHTVTVEDLDGDGKPDLATANATDNSVSILRNTCTPGTIDAGSFAPAFSLPAPAYTHDIKAVDIDGDGKKDLVVASVFGQALSLYRNLATPGTLTSNSFAARLDFPLRGRGHTISFGDLNGDGKPDIVVDTEIESWVSIFQNLSVPGNLTTQSLGARVDLATGWNAWGASVGDLDGDGRPDIVFCNGYDNSISVYQNIAGMIPGGEQPVPVIYATTPVSGIPGSAVAIVGTNFSPVAAVNIVYFGAVRAQVTAASPTNLSVVVPLGATYAPITVTVAGRVASAPGPFQPTFDGGGAALSAANFQPRLDLAAGDGAHRSVIADLDGDGKPDLGVANVYGHTVSLFRNISSAGALGTNSFEPRVDLPAPGGSSDNPYGFTAADVDGDGKIDLVACDRLGNQVAVYRNVASPGSLTSNSFAPYVSFPVGADPRYARVADLDGDGRPDIVSCNYAANTISILRNIGTPGTLDANSFAPPVDLPAGAGPYDVAIGDVDGDGKPDLVVVNQSGLSMSIYRNRSTPGTLDANSFEPRVDFAAPNGSDTVVLGDIDGDGKIDIVSGAIWGLNLSVFRNQSTPGVIDSNSFAARVDFPTDHWTHNVALADLNGDGKTDIAAVGELQSYLSLFQNQSAPGSFTSASLGSRIDLGTGWNAWGVSIGDLDGDGRPDIVFCNAYDDTVSIYRNQAAIAPTITAQPQDQTVAAGGTAQFSVSVTGTEPLTYQWFKAGNPLDGATGSQLALGGVQPAQAGEYYVAVSNLAGFAISSNALLTVLTFPPAITAQPADQSVYAGKTVSFTVQASGTAPLAYQWDKDGSPIPTATTKTYTLTKVQLGDAGNYRVTVTNDYGAATSRVAVLTVRPPPVCVPVPAGAVAWWPGQSNLWDIIGGFDGQFILPAPVAYSYAEGKVGTAIKISGSSYVQVPHSDGLNISSTNGLTIEGWIRSESVSPMPVVEWSVPYSRTNAGTLGVGLFLNGSGPGVIEATLKPVNSQQASVLVSAPNAVSNLVWQHVALTYNYASGYATLLVNGQTVANRYIGQYTLDTSGDFFLGFRSAGSYFGSRFRGSLDEFTLYNRALSVAEIQGIVTADEAGKCQPLVPPCVAPPPSVAAWWRWESNTLDSVAGNRALVMPTNFPVPLSYQTGRVGQAFAFRGPDFLQVPRADILDLGTEAGLTVEAWIYPSQYRPMPIVEWTDTNNFGVSLWLSYSAGPSVLEANLTDISGGYHVVRTVSGALTYNQWQHVALTYDKASGQTALYVNGSQVTVTNLGSFTPRTGLPLLIGYHPPNPSYYGGIGAPPSSPYWFIGAMDEVALYRQALGPAQIRRLANGKCPELPPTIGNQPQDQVALEGSAATFSVVAGGSEPLSYQWFASGQAIAGATGSALKLASVNPAQAGAYSVTVSNTLGAAASRPATLVVLPAGQCLPLPAGAVAFWRGESNTLDELGNHPAAWPSNAVPTYASGPGQAMVGTAFRFTGSTWLQVPASRDLDVGAGGGFTVEGWFKPDYIGGLQPLVDWNDGRANVGVGLMYSRTAPGALEVTLTDTNAYQGSERMVTFSTGPFALGSPTNPIPAWTHVALTFERVTGRASLFVNGKVAADRILNQVMTYPDPARRAPFKPATTGDLYFGWRKSGLYSGMSHFRGAMDEVTVYYRALSALEIQAIVAARANGKCGPQPSCLAIADDLAGWWRGEQNLLDSVNTNNGVGVSAGLSYTNGAVGYAMQFKGPSGYVRIPAAPALNVGAGGSMTFQAWMNPTFIPSSYTLAAWSNGYQEPGVSFGSSVNRGLPYFDPSLFEANLVDVAGNSHVITAPYRSVTNGAWQHVAVTYDRTTCLGVIFVNGSPVAVTNLGLFTPRTTGSLYFGYRPTGPLPGGGWGYLGGLDEVMIHNRALSSGDITASYRNAANRCMTPPLIVGQPASLRVNAGSNVTFTVSAVGNPVLRYQWLKNGLPIFYNQKWPADDASLVLTNVNKGNQGVYQVVVSNAFGFAASSNATLLVNYPPVADASATVPLLISPNDTNAVAVLDGSRSSDPDRDPLDYRWIAKGSGSLLATGVVAVVTLPVGTNVIDLVVSDGLLTSTAQVAVEVITTGQAVDRLAAIAESGAGNTQALVASLRATLASIARSQPATAINQLEAFINKVLAQLAPTDPVLADQLIAEAQAIIDALNGATSPVSGNVAFTSIANNPQGQPHLKIKGIPGRTYIIETSTDMTTWTMIGVAGHRGGDEYDFDDTQTQAGPIRFYRVVSP